VEHPVVSEIDSSEVAATWPVMHQLRPHLDLAQYVAAVARMRETDGYRLAAASVDGVIGAVAGFRVMEMLYCGRILYVDDLVSDAGMRSRGLGKALVDWLTQHAYSLGCGQLHLDSGLQRLDAHRFYERESMAKTAFHFASRIDADGRHPVAPVKVVT
jgi:GNAT superfamily N-acetyltransferase